MKFKELSDFLVVKPLEMQIRGKVYAFPGSISAETWIKLQTITDMVQKAAASDDYDPDEAAVPEVEEKALMSEMMGDTLAEMLADGISSLELDAVFKTLVGYHAWGEEAALRIWERQGEAPAPNRAQRRRASRSSVKSTRPRGSRSGSTKSQSDTPGETSSNTGT